MRRPFKYASQAYVDADTERKRAHIKHGYTISGALRDGMETEPWFTPGADSMQLRVCTEEFGEISKALNEFYLGNLTLDELKVELRSECIQSMAMLAAWVDAIDSPIDHDESLSAL